MLDWLRESWNFAMHIFSSIFTAMIICPETGRPKLGAATDAKLRLTYFDQKGPAQAIRDTFLYARIAFDDKRVTVEEFDRLKSALPYGQLPVLEVEGGSVFAQSKSILRYASKKARTYPSNPEDAAIIDEWCDLHTDFMQILTVNLYSDLAGLRETGYDAAAHRAWVIREHIPKYLRLLDAELSLTTWLGGMDSINMADFCWYPTLCWLHEGTFDGVTKETFDAYPDVLEHMQRVHAHLVVDVDADGVFEDGGEDSSADDELDDNKED